MAHKANLNQKADDGGTALLASVTFGHMDCLKALLASGADVELADAWNYAADGCRGGHSLHALQRPLVSLLLAKGAQVNAQDSAGRTPL